jgi:hypothetical protein
LGVAWDFSIAPISVLELFIETAVPHFAIQVCGNEHLQKVRQDPNENAATASKRFEPTKTKIAKDAGSHLTKTLPQSSSPRRLWPLSAFWFAFNDTEDSSLMGPPITV